MKKRIFIAVDISEEAKEKVSGYIESLKRDFGFLKVGWEKKEKLHITLKFLGDLEPEEIANVLKTVESAAEKISKFTVKIEQNGVFPNAKKGRILWLGLQDETGSLKKINDLLEEKLEKIGFPKEKRNFRPHLTLARLREPQKSGDLIKKHLETNFAPVRFEVSEIVIYESKLQPTGSIYFPVKKIVL